MKYLIYPGVITSIHDGEDHYISAGQLINLYRVDPRKCKIVRNERDLFGLNLDEYIALTPRKDGNYQLPPLTNNN